MEMLILKQASLPAPVVGSLGGQLANGPGGTWRGGVTEERRRAAGVLAGALKRFSCVWRVMANGKKISLLCNGMGMRMGGHINFIYITINLARQAANAPLAPH